jgi:hypothetical protein
MRILPVRAVSTVPPEPTAVPSIHADEAALLALTLQVGRMTASTMDVSEALSAVCHELPHAVDAAGATIVVAELPTLHVLASDQHAAWIGEI